MLNLLLTEFILAIHFTDKLNFHKVVRHPTPEKKKDSYNDDCKTSVAKRKISILVLKRN